MPRGRINQFVSEGFAAKSGAMNNKTFARKVPRGFPNVCPKNGHRKADAGLARSGISDVRPGGAAGLIGPGRLEEEAEVLAPAARRICGTKWNMEQVPKMACPKWKHALLKRREPPLQFVCAGWSSQGNQNIQGYTRYVF